MQEEIIYSVNRQKLFFYSIWFIACIALGFFLILIHKTFIGWANVIIFGLILLYCILILLTDKVYLKLNSQGFVRATPFNNSLIRWKDVERFCIRDISGAKLIAINYRPGYTEQLSLLKISKSVIGMEEAVSNLYEASLEEILKALNEFHTQYGRYGE